MYTRLPAKNTEGWKSGCEFDIRRGLERHTDYLIMLGAKILVDRTGLVLVPFGQDLYCQFVEQTGLGLLF